jgi:predicted CoA-binding protein
MFDPTVEILKKYDKIAVYGLSANENKPSHKVPMYMAGNGYDVIGINPKQSQIGDIKTYPKLSDIEEDIEILNVFRPSSEAKEIVRQALRRKEEKGDIKAVWLQLGIFDDEARRMAEEGGLEYIENACMLVEHGKM